MSTALVLSAGGSWGAMHVGMLRALRAHGVDWDLVVGTSAGGLNGAYLCSFADKDEGLERLGAAWRRIRRHHAFPISVRRTLWGIMGQEDHLVSPEALERWVRRHLRAERLEELPVPLHLVAVELLSGREVTFSDGEIVPRLMASAAIPVVFPPVEVDGVPHVDGGIGQYTPIRAAVDLGADRIWVLSTASTEPLSEPPRTALDVGLHAFNLLQTNELLDDLRDLRDRVRLHVVPPPMPTGTFPGDFQHTEALIEAAEARARRWFEEGGAEGREIPAEMCRDAERRPRWEARSKG